MSLRQYITPYAKGVRTGALLLLLTNVLDKAIPWLLKDAVDGLRQDDLSAVKWSALGVVGLASVLWFVRARSRIAIFDVGRNVEYDVRNELMRKVVTLGPSFFRNMPAGEVMSRATSDVAQIRALVGFGGMNVFNSVFAIGGALILMLLLSPELTLWALMPYPLVIVLSRTFGRHMYKRSLQSQEVLGELTSTVQEHLAGVRIVRSFALEDDEVARFDAINKRVVRANLRLVVIRGLMFPLLMSVCSIGTLIVVWRGGHMVLEGELSIGAFAAFNAYLAQLVWPTLAFGYLLSVVQRGRASYKRIREVLDAEPAIQPPPAPREPTGPGALEVRHLSFAYPIEDGGSLQALSDISFDVPAQTSIAIMGSVGSGKSTLAALLPRLLDTPPGTVRLDGVDVTQLDLQSLRRQVAFAQQEPFLFSTSVRQNIAFAVDDPGAPDLDARIKRAAEEACVWDEILGLQDGLETLVGERGVQLSGGQKQRIALSRALLSEPKVLILDDPMSAVDSKTEESILRALDRAQVGRTLVLITSRVAAASRMDRIIVLEAGRVIESGTPDALIQAGGSYARIAARQYLEQEVQGFGQFANDGPEMDSPS